MIYIASALAACFLAYSNGANDNFKGVTSLFGSKTTNYRTAISWGTITTFSGSITAIFIAQALLKKFSGKGLVPDAIVGSPQFLLAVAFGAALTVILATRIRISNLDHARNHGRDYRERAFGGAQRSQLRGARHWFRPASRAQSGAAIIVGALLYFIFHSVRLLFGVTKEWCVCIGCEERVVGAAATVISAGDALGFSGDDADRGRGANVTLASSSAYAANSDGWRAFPERGCGELCPGLNDTPKIVAMLLLLKSLDIRWGFFAVAATMEIGGLLNSRRIAETMSHKITAMNHGQGFSANLATGILVILASLFSLPVSTTHVSVGALFGIGLTTVKPILAG